MSNISKRTYVVNLGGPVQFQFTRAHTTENAYIPLKGFLFYMRMYVFCAYSEFLIGIKLYKIAHETSSKPFQKRGHNTIAFMHVNGVDNP